MIERKTSLTRALTVLCALMLAMSGVGPLALAGSGSAAPTGMSNIPSNAISEDVPTGSDIPITADQLDGKVMASDHSDSLAVTLTTNKRASELINSDSAVAQGNQMALILSDDQHSEGRRVAIDSGILQDALGYEPQAIYGSHESGEQWSAPAQYTDGYLVFDVPHFSTNTVTFSGKVSIDAQDVTSGTKFSYTLNSNSNPSNPRLILTGSAETNSKYRSWTTTGVKSISPSGNSVNNASIELSAPTESNSDTGEDAYGVTTGDIDGDGVDEIVYYDTNYNLKYYDTSSGISIDTNQQASRVATGDIDGDGEEEIIYDDTNSNLHYYDTSSDTATNTGEQIYGFATGDVDDDGEDEIVYSDQSNNLRSYDLSSNTNNALDPQITSAPTTADVDGDGVVEIVYIDYYDNVDYYDVVDNTETDTGENAWYASAGDVDGDGQAEVFYYGNDPTLRYYDTGSNQVITTNTEPDRIPTPGDVDSDGVAEIVYGDTNTNLKYYDGTSDTSVNTDKQASKVATGDIDGDGVGEIAYRDGNYNLDYYNVGTPITVDIDVGGDNTIETTLNIPEGGTKSASLPSLTANTGTIAISANAGIQSAELSYTEITKTSDPEITINSGGGTQTLTHTGTLANGEQIDLSGNVDMSKISGDTNINVNIATGKLKLAYSHTAQNQVSTIYDASAFQESYNIHYTYADATDNAKITIPFSSERVVGVKQFEYRINDGQWKPVEPTDRRFSNATATAYISQADGGPLPAGATVEIRAKARKVNVENGAVKITDATKPGEQLNTQLKIQSRSEGFSVDVGPTANGKRVHYAYSSAYPTKDYVVISADGSQSLYLPESQTGDTFRIKHLKTKVNPLNGDIQIGVKEPGSEPELKIAPGPGGSGDDVEITYYNTQSGVEYLLNSITRSIVIDSDTAQSPVVFEDDDSEEIWTIIRDSAPSGGASSGSALDGAGQFAQEQASGISGALGAISLPIPESIPQPILLLIVGIGGFVVVRRLGIFGGGSSSGSADDQPSGSGGSLIQLPESGIIASLQRAISGASSGLLRGLRGLLSYIGDILSIVLSNRRATIVGSIALAIGAAQSGLLSLPDGTGILLVVAGIPVASWLILRSRGAVSQRVWLASTLAAVILGLEFVASGTIQTAIEQLTSENVAPLLILAGAGALYLWYRQRQTESNTPDTVNRLIFNGDDD